MPPRKSSTASSTKSSATTTKKKPAPKATKPSAKKSTSSRTASSSSSASKSTKTNKQTTKLSEDEATSIITNLSTSNNNNTMIALPEDAALPIHTTTITSNTENLLLPSSSATTTKTSGKKTNNSRRRGRSPEQQPTGRIELFSSANSNNNQDQALRTTSAKSNKKKTTNNSKSKSKKNQNDDDDDEDSEDEEAKKAEEEAYIQSLLDEEKRQKENEMLQSLQDDDQQFKVDAPPEEDEDFENAPSFSNNLSITSSKKPRGKSSSSSSTTNKRAASAAVASLSRDQQIISQFESLAGLHSPRLIVGAEEEKKRKQAERKLKKKQKQKKNDNDDDDSDNDDDDEPLPAVNNNNTKNKIKIPEAYTNMNFTTIASLSNWFLLKNNTIYREPLKTAPTVPLDAIAAPLTHQHQQVQIKNNNNNNTTSTVTLEPTAACPCLLYTTPFALDAAGTDAYHRNASRIGQVIRNGYNQNTIRFSTDLGCKVENNNNNRDGVSGAATTTTTKPVQNVSLQDLIEKHQVVDRWNPTLGTYQRQLYEIKNMKKLQEITTFLTGEPNTPLIVNDTRRFDYDDHKTLISMEYGKNKVFIFKMYPKEHDTTSKIDREWFWSTHPAIYAATLTSVSTTPPATVNVQTDAATASPQSTRDDKDVTLRYTKFLQVSPVNASGSSSVLISVLLMNSHQYRHNSTHAPHQLRFALELATELRPEPFDQTSALTIAQQREIRRQQPIPFVVPFDFVPPHERANKMTQAQRATIAELFLRAKKLDQRFLLSIDWNDHSLEQAFRSRFVDQPDALPLQWPLGFSARDTYIVNKIVRRLSADETFKIVVPRGQQNAREALSANPIPDKLFSDTKAKFRLPTNIALQKHQKETIAWMRQLETQGSDSFLHVRLPSKNSDGTVHLSPLLSTFFATRPAHGKLHQMFETRDLNIYRRGGILASTVGLGKTLMVVATALLDVAENDAKKDDDPTKFPFITDKSCRCFVPFAGKSKNAFLDRDLKTSEREASEEGFETYKKNRHLQLAVKATLILAPVTLCRQWKSEIEKFFPAANVVIYHASQSRQNISYEDMANADFVITSYELYKKQLQKEASQTNSAGWCFSPIVYDAPSCFNNAFGNKTKIITQLSRIRWRRVVFDEYHKQGGLDSFRLETDLVECDFMWAVSGTPFHPSLWNSGFMRHLLAPLPIIIKYKDEIDKAFSPLSCDDSWTQVVSRDQSTLISQCKLLKGYNDSSSSDSGLRCEFRARTDGGFELENFVAHAMFRNRVAGATKESKQNGPESKNDHIFFRTEVQKNSNTTTGMSLVNYQLLSFLSEFMIRHTERDSKEISDIKVTEKIIKVRLSKTEYARYCENLELIKTQYRALAARGRVNARILRVIGLLNKLRHAACDPFSVTVDVANALQFEGGAGFDNENGRRNIITIPARIVGGLLFPNFANSNFFSLNNHPHIQEIQRQNGKEFNFVKNFAAIESLREDLEGLLGEEPELPTCALCADNVQQPVIVKCGHMYCRECILEFSKHQQQIGGGGNNSSLCPVCRSKTMTDNDKKVLLSFPQPPKQHRKQKKNGNDDDNEEDDDEHVDADDASAGNKKRPGPKTRAVVRLIQNVLDSDPNAKFVIFTVYIASSLRKEFDRCGIQSVYIDGSTSMEHRGRYVNDFQDPASTTNAFILNTRVANAGLTLTAANHLIIVEPATSKDVDTQMLGRVRRIGQKKHEVFVHRLIAEGTVEVPLRQTVSQQSLSLAGGKSDAQKTATVDLIKELIEHETDETLAAEDEEDEFKQIESDDEDDSMMKAMKEGNSTAAAAAAAAASSKKKATTNNKKKGKKVTNKKKKKKKRVVRRGVYFY